MGMSQAVPSILGTVAQVPCTEDGEGEQRGTVEGCLEAYWGCLDSTSGVFFVSRAKAGSLSRKARAGGLKLLCLLYRLLDGGAS
jgi:hypothetical protein